MRRVPTCWFWRGCTENRRSRRRPERTGIWPCMRRPESQERQVFRSFGWPITALRWCGRRNIWEMCGRFSRAPSPPRTAGRSSWILMRSKGKHENHEEVHRKDNSYLSDYHHLYYRLLYLSVREKEGYRGGGEDDHGAACSEPGSGEWLSAHGEGSHQVLRGHPEMFL